MRTAVLSAALMLAGGARASSLLGPIHHLQGKHIGDADPISWKIEYYDAWGRTVVDAQGGHFYHDRCCGGYLTHDPSWQYDPKYWGQYEMYYIGTTMRYRITLTNNGPRNYRNLRVVAIQEYLTQDGSWGEWISPDAAKDWYLEEFNAGQSVVLEGSLYIPPGAHGGLDQTHLQVQHWNRGEGQPGPGSVILDDTKAAIWCPPEAGAPGSAVNGGAAAVTVAGGLVSGTPEGGAGAVGTIRVFPAAPGAIAVRLYDRRGNLVRELSAYAGGAGPVTIAWDGLTDAGVPAPAGVYLAVATGPGVSSRTRIAVAR
jgi:hypothetical protein